MPGKERDAARRAGWRSRRPFGVRPLGLRQLLLAAVLAAFAAVLFSGPALADGWFHGPSVHVIGG